MSRAGGKTKEPRRSLMPYPPISTLTTDSKFLSCLSTNACNLLSEDKHFN